MPCHLKSLFLVFVVACLNEAARGDTIALWRFDDGIPTSAATTLQNAVGGTELTATASRTGTGTLPAFSADIPGAATWPSFAGPGESILNGASLFFTNAGLPSNTNSTEGGCLTLSPASGLLLSNLTVEAFVKVNRHVNWALIAGKRRSDGNGTSWSIGVDSNGKPRVRIDSQPLGTTAAPGFNQSWVSSSSIEDGKWHHLAFTFSHTNRAVRLYVDRSLCASGNAFSNLVYDACEIRIGQGCGDRAFDGWIDEVRVSGSVLTPDLFMSTNAPTSTLGYWSFDDGTGFSGAGVLTNDYYYPLMNGTAAAAGGSKPSFSPETPVVETRRITDGTNGPVANVNNTASLRFSNAGLPGNTNSTAGGVVTIPGSTVARSPSSLTVEAFIKVDRHVNYAQIAGKARSLTGGYSWLIGVNASGNFRGRFDSQLPPSTTGYNQCFESSAFVEDGKWHHVAMTYDEPSLNVCLYVDYRKVYEKTLTGPVVLDAGDIKIGSGDRAFDGWIDEVRITRKLLAVEDFLYSSMNVGSVTAVQ